MRRRTAQHVLRFIFLRNLISIERNQLLLFDFSAIINGSCCNGVECAAGPDSSHCFHAVFALLNGKCDEIIEQISYNEP